MKFNLPKEYRNGHETLEYSFRLMNGMHPVDYKESLQNTETGLLILVGTEDEVFHVAEFEPGILPYKANARIAMVEGETHLGILMSEQAMAEAARWMAAR